MKQVITALIKAQSAFLAVKKTAENPFYKSKYADLETCIEATQDALNKNGLVVVQNFSIENGRQSLETRLFHDSGEYLRGVQYLDCKDMADPQKVGSASTYARRYGYMAILGIAPEDDDANEASKGTPAQPIKKEDKPQQPVMATQKIKTNIKAEILGVTWNEVKKRSEYEVETADHEHFVVFIKKPQITVQECQKVEIIGYWTSDFKGKLYHMAEDIKVEFQDEIIPF